MTAKLAARLFLEVFAASSPQMRTAASGPLPPLS
jgi:hypothetical protein